MATKYTMNFTDRNKDPFFIRSYTTNGPINPNSETLPSTSSAAATSLLLHGKGMDNYGERIQENLIHLLENFASHNKPVFPINGQLWLDTAGSPTYQMLVYNSNADDWDYFLKTNDQVNFDAGGRKIVNLGSPSDPRDAVNLASLNIATMSDTNITSPSDNDMLVYIGGEWINRGSPAIYVPTAGGTMSGPLFLSGAPTEDLHAATKLYVDSGGVSTLGGLSDVIINAIDIPSTGSPATYRRSLLVFDPITDNVNWINSFADDFAAAEGIILSDGSVPMTVPLTVPVNLVGSPLIVDREANATAASVDYVDQQDGITLQLAQDYTDTQVGGGGSIVTQAGTTYADDPTTPVITIAQSGGSPAEFNVTIPMPGVKETTSDLVDHTIGDPNNPAEPTDVDLSEFTGGLAFEELFASQFFDTVVPVERILAEFNLAFGEFVAPKRHITFTSGAGGTIYTGNTASGAQPDQMNPTGNLEPQGIFPHVGHHALTIYVDGVKQIVSESGYRRVTGNFPGSPSNKFNLTNRIRTGLGSPGITYSFNITVNGVGPVAVDIPGVASMEEVVDEINTVADNNYWLGGSPQNAGYQFGCDLIDGDLTFYSGNPGTGSTIVLADVDLFSSLVGDAASTGLFDVSIGSAIDANYAPVDRDYVEVGRWGEPTDQIQFVGSPVIGSVVELTLDHKLFGA